MQFQQPQSLFLPKESVIPYQLPHKIYGNTSNSYRESPHYTIQAMESSNISDYQNQNVDPSRINHRNPNHRIQQLQGMIKTLATEDQHMQNLNYAANQVELKREQNQYGQQPYYDQANISDSPARISSSYSQNQLRNQIQMKSVQQESAASSQYLQQYNTQNSNTNLQYFIRPSQYTKIQSNSIIDLDRSAQNSSRSFQVSHNDLAKKQAHIKTTQQSTITLNNCKSNQSEHYSHSSSSSCSSHSSSSSTSKNQTNRKTKHSSSHHHKRHHSNKKKNIDAILLENCCQLVKEVSLSRQLMELFSLTVGSGEHFRRLFLQRKYSDALVALFSLVLALIRMNPAGAGTVVAPGNPNNLIPKNSFFEPSKQKDNYSSKLAYNFPSSQRQNGENQRDFEAHNQGLTQSRVLPISSCHVFGSDQQEFFGQRNSPNEHLKSLRNQLNQVHPVFQQTPTGTDTTNSQSFHDQPQYMKDQGYLMKKNSLADRTNSNHQKSKQYEREEESQQESQSQQYKKYWKHSQHEPQWELYNAEFSNNKQFNRQDGNSPSMTSQDFDDDSSNQRNNTYNQKINNATSSKQPLTDQNRSKVKDILHPTHSNSNLVSSKKSEHLLQKKSALSSECHIHQGQQEKEELDQYQESCCSKHCVSENTKIISNQKRLERNNLVTPKQDKKITKLLTNNNISSKTIHLMPCMKGRGDKSSMHESTEKSTGDNKTTKSENQNLKRDTSTNSLRRDYQTKETDSRYYNKHTNNSSFSENQQASKPEFEEEKKKQKIMDSSQPRWKQ